jgi:hypothetical protein
MMAWAFLWDLWRSRYLSGSSPDRKKAGSGMGQEKAANAPKLHVALQQEAAHIPSKHLSRLDGTSPIGDPHVARKISTGNGLYVRHRPRDRPRVRRTGR